ncbi:MAG: nucleotide sugar dehydrogenase, partial [Planctomycetota bacterium]
MTTTDETTLTTGTPAGSMIESTPMQMDAGRELLEKVRSKTARVTVMGLGYVGLPLVQAVHQAGFHVIGYDVDESKIGKLRKGEGYLKHLGPELARSLAASDRFRATSDTADIASADIVVLCVPTPLGEHREPDLSYVLNSTEITAQTLRSGQLVVLESTTYPGTTRDEMVPVLERGAAQRGLNLKAGRDFFVAYSPEREDPGRAGFTTSSIPKLVGGIDHDSGRLASAFYQSFIERVHDVSSAEVAEGAKLLENIYRAVNIALVNELKVVLDRMGIDIWEVVDAASTKPFGYRASALGRSMARARGLPLIEVQHHHAHIAACMMEHELPDD